MTPYHGFGPSAHSYDGRTRSWNHKNIDAYMQALESGDLPVESRETLTREQKMIEMILLRFRTLEGLDLEKFKIEFSISFEVLFKDLIDRVCSDSLGFIKDKRFALTLEGKAHLDGILEAFAERVPSSS
jgi:oxygen-independent coproporphyrinogen-3 oxidase